MGGAEAEKTQSLIGSMKANETLWVLVYFVICNHS